MTARGGSNLWIKNFRTPLLNLPFLNALHFRGHEISEIVTVLR